MRGLGKMPTEKRLVTVTIHGQWPGTVQEIAERVDNALCDAGLCGCNAIQGYTLTVSADNDPASHSVRSCRKVKIGDPE